MPPLDLGQVEIIKGVASALYGASALGGVINLVSRRPRERGAGTRQRHVAVRTRRDDVDCASPTGRWGRGACSAATTAAVQDLDDDGWSVVPAFERGVRPAATLLRQQARTTLLATVGATVGESERRDLSGRVAPDGQPFAEA